MKRLAWIAVGALAALLLLALAWQLRGAVLLFALSLVLAAAVRPAVTALMGRGLRSTPAVLVVYGLGLLGVGLTIVLLGGVLWFNAEQTLVSLLAIYDDVIEQWPNGAQWQRLIAGWVRAGGLPAMSAQALEQVAFGVVGATLTVFDIASQSVAVVFLSLYWSLDRDRFERLWLSWVSPSRRTQMQTVWQTIESATGAYVLSTLLRSGLALVLLSTGLTILGVTNGFTLAALTAVLLPVPWVGSLLAWAVVVVIVALTQQPGLALAAVLLAVAVILGVTAIDHRWLRRHRPNPLLLVIVLIAMFQDYGLVGLFAAPMVAIVLGILIDTVFRMRLEDEDVSERQQALELRLASLHARLHQVEVSASPPLRSLAQRLDNLITQSSMLVGDPDDGGPSREITRPGDVRRAIDNVDARLPAG